MTRRQLKEICDVCKERVAMHTVHGAGNVKVRLCCICHISRGGVPADWHIECVRAARARAAKNEPSPGAGVTSVLRAHGDI